MGERRLAAGALQGGQGASPRARETRAVSKTAAATATNAAARGRLPENESLKATVVEMRRFLTTRTSATPFAVGSVSRETSTDGCSACMRSMTWATWGPSGRRSLKPCASLSEEKSSCRAIAKGDGKKPPCVERRRDRPCRLRFPRLSKSEEPFAKGEKTWVLACRGIGEENQNYCSESEAEDGRTPV